MRQMGGIESFAAQQRPELPGWRSSHPVALSHTVIEEDLDQRIIDGLEHKDEHKLTDLPDVPFRAGTSEIKNWDHRGGCDGGGRTPGEARGLRTLLSDRGRERLRQGICRVALG